MERVPIKRGQTEEQIEYYYTQLKLRAKEDLYFLIPSSKFGWLENDHPNYIKCSEYGHLGYTATAFVVHPLVLVFNYIYRYHRDHTPWETIPIPTESHPLLSSDVVYRCLRKICRENQVLFLKQFTLTNRQRDTLLTSLQIDDYEKFMSVYGDLNNDQEVSNLCWELGLYHPDEDELIFSRLMETPELYFDYRDRTRQEDWEEIEHVPMTNLELLNRVQGYYEDYCEGRQLLIEYGDIINKKEKELINEILMRPEGELFRIAYESGKEQLIEYNPETLVVVNMEDHTITSCPPFDYIDWNIEDPFPVGIVVEEGKSASMSGAQHENHEPREDVIPGEGGHQDKPSKKKAGRNRGEWLSEKYSMYSDEQVGIELRTTLWFKLQQILAPLPLPNVGKSRTKGDLKSLGAALLFYVFKQLGIALEDATYGRPFERAMVVMGAEEGKLMGNTFRAGPFARNSTKEHLAAVSKILPALCQLKDGKRIDISKLRKEGSPLEQALINGHVHLMDAYQYLIEKLPEIFEGTSDNPTNDAEADSD